MTGGPGGGIERKPAVAGLLLPKRSLGQNFLVHRGTARTIVDFCRLEPDDHVVELGVGLGALTREIQGRVTRVIGIEIDRRFVAWLGEKNRVAGNVELRQADMLEISFRDIALDAGGKIKVVGNLPYNISSQILFRLFADRDFIAAAVLMFQKEVAERLVARPGSKRYGILSVLTGYCAAAERLMDVPPTVFRPRPKVTSTVVRLRFQTPKSAVLDFDFFRTTVRKAFQQRRKTICNALKGIGGLANADIVSALSECGIDGHLRAEDLDRDGFVQLSDALYSMRGRMLTGGEGVG